MTRLKNALTNLNQNLRILLEREAKYGGTAPLDLLNQIDDHKQAIALTEQVLAGELSESEWREALKPLLGSFEDTQVTIDQRSQQISHQINVAGDYYVQSAPQISHKPLQRPPRAQHFVGRGNELAQLLGDLKPGQVVTLRGPGGVGKSALAAEAVWTLAPGNKPPRLFPDGIVYHSFYNQPQSDLALESIVRTLGDEPRPTPHEAAKRALAGKQALLILDGAEEADDLGRVLSIASSCGVLITTRLRQDVAARIQQEIASLSLTEATELLFAWVGKQKVNQMVAEQICELVGQLPLAVQLVGRYLAETNEKAEDFLGWLRDTPLQALDHGNRRLESVPVLLEHSLNNVSDEAKQVLSIVGVLALAPFDQDIIIAAMGISRDQAEEYLNELVDIGIVSKQSPYRVSHVLIHTYIRQRLRLPKKIIKRIAAYFEELVNEQSEKGVKGYARLDIEKPHILAVIIGCVEQKVWEAAKNLAWAVDSYLDIQGHWAERVVSIEAGLTASRMLKDRKNEETFLGNLGLTFHSMGQLERAIECYEQALTIAKDINDRRGESNHLGNLGLANSVLGKIEQAIDYYQQALALSREIGDRQGESNRLSNLGNVYSDLGQIERAIDHYQQALLISQEIGDRRGESERLNNLGNTYRELGKIEQAIDYYQQALTLSREIGDRRGEANRLSNLGNVYSDLGQIERAIDHYQQALLISQEIGDRRGEEAGLGNLGNVYSDLGRIEQAIDYYQQALVISREIGDRRGEEAGLGNLANAYNSLEQIDRAIDYYQQALVISREIGNRRDECTWMANLGNAYRSLGQIERAVDYFHQALIISKEIGNRRIEGRILSNFGIVYNELGQLENAIDYHQQALNIQQEIGDRQGEGLNLGSLGDAFISLGQIKKATEYFQQALVIAREIGDQRGEVSWLSSLGNACYEQKQMGQAAEFYEQALSNCRKSENCEIEAKLLTALGKTYTALGLTERAINSYEQVLTITLDNQDLTRAAEILVTLGNLAREAKRFENARQFWLESKNIYLQLKSPLVSSVEALLDDLQPVESAFFTLGEIAQKFFALAGFSIEAEQGKDTFLCHPRDRIWKNKFVQPIPIIINSGNPLDSEEIQKIFQSTCHTLGSIPPVVFVVIDRALVDDGWLQIATLRAKNVQIIPIDDVLLYKGQEEGRQRQVLERYLRRFTKADRDLYNVRDPVADRLNFFGREVLATEVEEDLNDGRPLATFGLRKMGKSSLLNYLRDRLTFPTALVDLQTGTELTDLYQRILNSWESSLRVKLKDLTWSPPRLTESSNPSMAFSTAARELLDRLEEQSLLPRLGIMVDEADVVFPQDKHGIENYLSFSRMLRGLVQEENRISLMIAGVDPSLNRTNRIGGQQNPLYQFFREIYLPALNFEDCKQMIRNIGRQMGLVYSDEAVSFVAMVTGGHPFLARQLCSLAFRQLGGPGEVPLEHLQQVAIRFIREPGTAELLDEKGLWGEVVDPHIWPQPQIIENERVLCMLAQIEPQPEATLVSHAQNRRACERSLDELERRAVLGKPEVDSFDINLRLFRNWIRRYKLGEV